MYRILVFVSYVVMAISNILSTTTGVFNHMNNTAISKNNPTALTPDGITFAVWGPIYLFEFGTVLYQCWPKGTIISDTSRKWLSVAFLSNAVWLPLFAFEYWWLSLAVIGVYYFSLYELYYWTVLVNYANCKHWKDKLWVYTGISLNMAWITVAGFLNLTIVFRNSRIMYTQSGDDIIGGNADWAVAVVVVSSAIAIYNILASADIVYGLATIWALLGISRYHDGEQSTWAFACAITVTVFASVRLAMAIIKRPKQRQEGQPLLSTGV